MNKRGQVTLFIVLGLIILLTTSLLFASQSILQTQEKQPKILVPGVDLSLQVYIENCLEKTTIKGTTLLMAQGGYENPLFFVPFQENKAPYYLEYNSDTAFLLSPSKKMMEEELSLYIEKNLESCMQHFAPFAREGIMITENNSLQLQNDILQIPGIQVIVSQPKAEVQIGTDKKITSSLHFPIHIKEGERKKELRDFSISIHSPLAKLHALAQEISEQQRANEMDLSILLDIAEREEISYQLTFINNSHTVIYSLYDLKPQIDEFEKIDFKDKESFNFAVKYHWPEEKFVSESFLIPKSFSLEAKITNNQQKQQQKNYQKQQKPSKTISLSGKAITFLGEEVPQQENSFPTEMISSEIQRVGPYAFVDFETLFSTNPLETAQAHPADYMQYLQNYPDKTQEIIQKNPQAYEAVISQDIAYANQNPEALKIYFTTQGVEFASLEGGFESFDGNHFLTKAGNKFTADHLKNLVAGGAEKLTIDKDGLFTFVRKEKNYALLAGTFETVENKISLVSGILESEEFGTISIDIPEEQPKTMIVFGEQISLMGGGIAFGDNFLFAGGVILHSPEHIEILKGSKLTLAIPGSKQDQLPEQSTSEKTEKKEEISRIFLGATKETDIFFDKKNHQGNKKSWIQISRNTLRVTAEDNAELTLGITSTPFKEVAVDSLRGIVTLNDELEGKKFSLILKRGRYSVVGPAKFSRRIVAEGVQFSPEGITNCKIYCQQVMGIEDDEFIQDSRTIEELLNEGKNAKDPYQRAAALAELEKQYGAADISTQEKIRQAWITALDDENQRVRLSALAKLALLQEIPMPHVIASLADDNLAIREFAVQILPSLKMDTQEKINLIQQTFAQEKEDEIKRVLLMSLSEMKENAPRRWIYSILRDKQLSNKVRNGAALAFIRLQTPEDKALLLETFLDLEETPEIRQTILYFSPDLFSTEEEWKNALLDKNPEVRKTAANHLVLAVEENKVNRIQILSEALIIEDTPDTKASQLFSMQSIIQQMPPKEVLDFVQNNPEIIGELMQQLNDKQMIKGGAQVGWLASAAYTSIVKSLEELATVSHSPQKEDALNTALDLEFARLITLEQIDPESNFRQKIEEIRKREYIHIKDIPFLLQVEKSDLAQTSDSLIAEIQQRSASQTHLSREDNPGYVSEGPEQVNELSYGELLKVKKIMDALQDPAVRKSIGDLIARDLDNKNSEVGGVLVLIGGKVTFEERAPLNEEGNGIYPLEQQTIHDSRKVANFHLHSSTENSKPYAGPSGNSQHGDIGLVFAQQIDGLVITKLEGNKFNVDFYTPGGAPISTVTKNLPVVDLGNYEYE